MKLKVYMAIHDIEIEDFVKSFPHYEPSYISRVARGKTKPGKKLWREIVKFTGGIVTHLVTIKEPIQEEDNEENSHAA